MKMPAFSLAAAAVLVLSAAAVAQTPARIEKEILTHLDKLSQASNYSGTRDVDEQAKQNNAIEQALIRYGKLQSTITYGFPALSKKMYIVTSPDKRLRIYSWDMESGGTMHDFASVFQYRGRSGKVHTWATPDDETGAGSFYTQLFQVDAAAGPVYLANSSFIGSTSYHGQSIEAISIDGEKLKRRVKIFRTPRGLRDSISFNYDFFTVLDRRERPIKLFYYDSAKRSLRFPIVIEDRKTPQGRVTDRYITYRFNGSEFVKVS